MRPARRWTPNSRRRWTGCRPIMAPARRRPSSASPFSGQGRPRDATPGGVARGGADVDPAAETQMAYRVAGKTPAPTPNAPFSAKPEDQADTDDFAFDFSAFDRPAAPPEDARRPAARIGRCRRVDAVRRCRRAGAIAERQARSRRSAAEQPRPFVRGKSAERRRPPSRYGRGDATDAGAWCARGRRDGGASGVRAGEADAGVAAHRRISNC